MRGSRILLTTCAIASLASATAQAQPRRPQQPSDRVQIPAVGRVSMIGVRLSEVTADNMTTLKVQRLEGAVVESVNPKSPAAAAGLHEHDVIVQFDGERVRSAGHLARLVGETPAGREVSVGVMRDGRRVDLKVKPDAANSPWFDPRFGGAIDSGDWQEQMEEAGRVTRELGRRLPEVMEGLHEGKASNRGRLGASVQELHGDLAEYFGVRAGVLVTGVAPETAAARAGLKAGDVITAINGKAVATPRELIGALPTSDASQEVMLTVVRDKKATTLKAMLGPAGTMNRPARGPRI